MQFLSIKVDQNTLHARVHNIKPHSDTISAYGQNICVIEIYFVPLQAILFKIT